MVSKKSKSDLRTKKHYRLRNRLSGTTERPRLAVFRSNNHMYAQIIDDTVGNTVVSASTLEKSARAELSKTNDVDAAAFVGTLIAKRALEKGITKLYLIEADLSIKVRLLHWRKLPVKQDYNSNRRRNIHEETNHRSKQIGVK